MLETDMKQKLDLSAFVHGWERWLWVNVPLTHDWIARRVRDRWEKGLRMRLYSHEEVFGSEDDG